MEPSEQTPSTPPTKRRRRRWLIVALVFVVTTVSWWNWPRGDGRFVGKWNLEDRSPPYIITLRRNGTAITFEPPNDRRLSRWRIDGRYLTTGIVLPDWLGQAISTVAIPMKSITGYTIDHGNGEDRVEIIDVSESTMHFRTDAGELFEFTRIPE